MNTDITNGNTDGKKWLRGTVPLGQGRVVFIDTRTGQGIKEICEALKKFVSYQSLKTKFPSFSQEDVLQELYLLAIEAIPSYDVTKNTNMLTFLQGHVQKRLINKCKYISEKKRQATYYNTTRYKVRCPVCRGMTVLSEGSDVVCGRCGNKAGGKTAGWKTYNIPVLPIPIACIAGNISEEAGSVEDCFSEDNKLSSLLGVTEFEIDKRVQMKLDFMKLYNRLDNTNRKIVKLLLEGYEYKEVAENVGISEKAAYARVSKIINSQRAE